jgi:hypothetical protein
MAQTRGLNTVERIDERLVNTVTVAMLDKVKPNLTWVQANEAAKVAVAFYILAQRKSGTLPRMGTLSSALTEILAQTAPTVEKT